MSTKKKIVLPRIGEVYVHRKKGMRSIRLRVNNDSNVVLSLPKWVLLSQAIRFAQTKTDWVLKEKAKRQFEIKDGSRLACGVGVSIHQSNSKKPSSQYLASTRTLRVILPTSFSKSRSDAYTKKKINELLKTQSEQLLLSRLKWLATQHDFEYKSASVALLKSRWGSCDHEANIRLSAYLVQLPDHLIDYVLLHELNHTKHMNHSQKFWRDLEKICPTIGSAKKELKNYTPSLMGI